MDTSFKENLNKISEELKKDYDIIDNNIKLTETDNKNINIWLKIYYKENKIIFLPYVGTKNSIALKKKLYNYRYKEIIIECDNEYNIENILKNNIEDFLYQ
jgi:hypothetical protein